MACSSASKTAKLCPAKFSLPIGTVLAKETPEGPVILDGAFRLMVRYNLQRELIRKSIAYSFFAGIAAAGVFLYAAAHNWPYMAASLLVTFVFFLLSSWRERAVFNV